MAEFVQQDAHEEDEHEDRRVDPRAFRAAEILVEVRRVNERIKKMISDENKPYQQLAIARYLAGVLYEDQGELDSAFIEYEAAQKLAPGLEMLMEPVLRLAKATDRDSAYDKLKAQFPGVKHEPRGGNEGDLVIIIEAGLSPEKHSMQRNEGPNLIDVPVYRQRSWRRGPGLVKAGALESSAMTVTSIDQVAQLHLDDRIGRILLKAIASTGIKAGLAAGVGQATNSRGLGLLTFLLLSTTNQADLRSWLALPAEFQVARLRLSAGEHEVTVQSCGQTTKHKVAVKPKRNTLLVLRRY